MQLNYPAELPISTYREAFLDLLQSSQVIVVSGETGSGKTTQLPKFCLESYPDETFLIGCTQPRRIAATSVAARVAEELGSIGRHVGCKIRFHDHTDKHTRIKFMTDGVLLAETRTDPLLKRYGVIIIDEAHERSLNIDFLLGYLKKILPKRPDLKLIVTSATIDTAIFSRHFSNAPVLGVEGRSYPVDVHYQPPNSNTNEEELSYVEHCAATLTNLFREQIPRDTLLFLPTEKDIRECCSLLEKKLPDILILPMFGRLPSADQKKIFRPAKRVKVVVATNVAETSITVPGIRYVIDTGLARISQYNVRAGTTSLPVSRISRASADQRKGRCGRIGPGICIRLFSEEDYEERDEYTLPEIKRSNLAEVILQMTAMNLGSPLQFPFIEPPHAGAIRDGYKLLKELQAIRPDNRLTKIGTIMAHLPIDPQISRILIAARENNCLREIRIIAPALAIQDPRVRPADHEKDADTAHEQFADKHSDFLSLLNIWNLFHNVKNKTHSWGRLKKFCKLHFLSFQRMREWIDLHDQLASILKKQKGFSESSKESAYPEIHKSLCSGFLRNIAVKKENKIYQGAGNKELMVFPGSDQFKNSGKWIIAASFLETNRLYGLTVADIDPEWLIHSAAHLCRRTWANPRWQKKSGQVIADETVSLFGLILSAGRKVNYGRTSPANRPEARDIFIQSALLANEIQGNYPFLKHNLDLLQKWQETEERLRKRNLLVDDTVLHDFYTSRLPASVYDRFTLNRYLRGLKDQIHLQMQEEEILTRHPKDRELQDFPKKLRIGKQSYRLHYHLSPGDDDDGVTVRIPLAAADTAPVSSFEWLVPGLLQEKVTFLLKGLPKRLRKHLIPLNNSVDMLLDNCNHYQGSLYVALEAGIFKLFRIQVGRSDWPDQLPPHLQMRFLLFDGSGRTVASGRNLPHLLQNCTVPNTEAVNPNRNTAKKLAQWENRLFTGWDFEGLPRQTIVFSASGEVSGSLYPKLETQRDRGGVTLCFSGKKSEADDGNTHGMLFLYQLQFSDQFKNLKKYCYTSLSSPSSLWLTGSGNRKESSSRLLFFIMRNLFAGELSTIPPLNIFTDNVTKLKKAGLYQEGRKICDSLLLILRKRKEVSDHISRYAELARKMHSYDAKRYKEYETLLDEILPADFLQTGTIDFLSSCLRSFKALIIRIERAHANPAKDAAKTKQLIPHLQKLEKIKPFASEYQQKCREEIDFYRRMVNEFRIGLFAPEIKKELQVSEKKLKQQWQKIRSNCPGM